MTAIPPPSPAEPDRPALARAAVAFGLGAVFFAYAFTLRVSPSVMVEDLMRDLAVGAAVLGNLSAFYFYAYAGLQVPVGLVLDRFGPRRPMSLAAAAVALGAFAFAAAPGVETAYAGRLLIGAGCAFSWAGTLAIVNQWFPSRFALLAGVSQLVAMGGAVLGQAPLAPLVERVGWRDTMMALAAGGAGLAVLIGVVARDRARPPGHVHRMGAGLRAVLGHRQTWLAAGFGLAMTAPMLAFGGLWGVPFLQTVYDLDRTAAAGVASLVFVGNGAGGVLIGGWSDWLGRRKPAMAAAGVLCVASQIAYVAVPGLPLALVAALVLASGVGGSAMILAFATAREHNPLRHAGLTIGLVNTAVVGSGALLQPLIGVLLDLSWTGAVADGVRVYEEAAYRQALLASPAVGLLGLGALAAIGETRGRQQR